jgi:hypothetical protein
MTVRKQLELQLAAIRVVWAMTPPAAMPRIGEITLECQPAVLSVSATRGVIGRINASPVGGAGAEYLLVRGIRIEPIATGGGGGLGYRVTVLVAYRERPWVGQTTDLDALLDALEAGAGMEAPPETWRTRKGML